MDKQQRINERNNALNNDANIPHAVKVMREQRTAPVMVRVSPSFSFGSCEVMGRFIKETAKSLTYICPVSGQKKSARKEKKGKYAGSRTQRAHTELCPFCPEMQEPGSCMHGRKGWCETCASM